MPAALKKEKQSQNSGRKSKSFFAQMWRSVVVSSGPSWPVADLSSRIFRHRLRIGLEVSPATRAELGFIPDHAHGDTIDVGNLGAAETKSVIAARLLLLRSIGMAGR